METPIKIYYHVYGINHYIEIATEQINTIIESGLYDRCESINIGFLGTEENLVHFKSIFGKYDKIKIREHSEDATRYEFHTLRIKESSWVTLPLHMIIFLSEGMVCFNLNSSCISLFCSCSGSINSPNG